MAKLPLRELVRKRLRAFRLAKGFTQEQLCEKAGLSLDAVSRIEGGSRSPTLDTLERLASALGVSVSELVWAEAAAPLAVALPVQRISRLLETRSAKMQQSVEDVVRVLVKVLERD